MFRRTPLITGVSTDSLPTSIVLLFVMREMPARQFDTAFMLARLRSGGASSSAKFDLAGC
jgi:hypothetical protein